MLRLVWFILKIGLLVAAALWVASKPGQVHIQWQDYDINIHFGFFLLVCFISVLLTIGLTRFFVYFINLPSRYRDKKSFANAEKGLDALTLSLSSAASGDYGHAQFQAARALKLLPGQQTLPLLIQAGAQRKQGAFEDAEESLKSMLTHPEGAVLAARALVNNALDSQDISRALLYARTAEQDYKGRDKAWLLATLYELEAKMGHWEEAEVALNNARKKKAISQDKAAADYVAIATERARLLKNRNEDQTAAKILKAVLKKQPAFAPAVEALFDLHITNGKKRAASNLLKKAWKIAPHPDFTAYWDRLGALYNKGELDMTWITKLTAQNPDHAESHYILACKYMEFGEFEKARIELDHMLEADPTKRVFKVRAEVAEKSGASEVSVRQYLEGMSNAPADRVWICQSTGRTYDHWNAIAEPHKAFNTLIWSSPDHVRRDMVHPVTDDAAAFDLLTAA